MSWSSSTQINTPSNKKNGCVVVSCFSFWLLVTIVYSIHSTHSSHEQCLLTHVMNNAYCCIEGSALSFLIDRHNATTHTSWGLYVRQNMFFRVRECLKRFFINLMSIISEDTSHMKVNFSGKVQAIATHVHPTFNVLTGRFKPNKRTFH